VAWLLHRFYKPARGSALARMGSEPLLSAHLLRRFAVRNNTFLAHVRFGACGSCSKPLWLRRTTIGIIQV
jgi:hypothetical protein